jgi:hypothetical protein
MSRAFLYDEARRTAAVHETPVPATA